MKDPQRGEVWWGEIAEVGRRPFLVMSRAAVIPLLKSVIAVAITRTVRGIPTELALGVEDGMPTETTAGIWWPTRTAAVRTGEPFASLG